MMRLILIALVAGLTACSPMVDTPPVDGGIGGTGAPAVVAE